MIKQYTRKCVVNTASWNDSNTGQQTIAHNLGRTPKKVRITAMWGRNITDVASAMSIGTMVDSNTTCVYVSAHGNDYGDIANGYIVYIYKDSNPSYSKATISVDKTNIYLNWSNSGNNYNMNIVLLIESE